MKMLRKQICLINFNRLAFCMHFFCNDFMCEYRSKFKFQPPQLILLEDEKTLSTKKNEIFMNIHEYAEYEYRPYSYSFYSYSFYSYS